jgi:hypothetical protein
MNARSTLAAAGVDFGAGGKQLFRAMNPDLSHEIERTQKEK